MFLATLFIIFISGYRLLHLVIDAGIRVQFNLNFLSLSSDHKNVGDLLEQYYGYPYFLFSRAIFPCLMPSISLFFYIAFRF